MSQSNINKGYPKSTHALPPFFFKPMPSSMFTISVNMYIEKPNVILNSNHSFILCTTYTSKSFLSLFLNITWICFLLSIFITSTSLDHPNLTTHLYYNNCPITESLNQLWSSHRPSPFDPVDGAIFSKCKFEYDTSFTPNIAQHEIFQWLSIALG